MRVVAVLAVCACNPAFGLHGTDLAPPDAPPPTSCPPIGTAPQYSGTFHQVLAQNCSDYSPSFATGTALAQCANANVIGVFGGPLDQPVTPLAFPTVAQSASLVQPRLAPEGDFALVDNSGFDSIRGDLIGEYRPVDASTWMYVRDSGLPRGTDILVGAITAGPHRHVMWADSVTGLHEYVRQDSGAWLEAATTGALGLTSVYGPANLTVDGLRLLVPTQSAIYYADRASIDAPFSPAVPITDLPSGANAPVLSPDCTRVYFAGVERVFYVEQR